MSFGVNNLRNAWPMMLILFYEHWNFNVAIENAKKYPALTIFSFKIIWFVFATVNSLYYYENTRSWHSKCDQAVLKSQIWLKITSCNSIWLRLMKIRIKVLFCWFQEFFGLVNTFTSKEFLETSPVMHLNQHIFWS